MSGRAADRKKAGERKACEYTIDFPQSCVLYLRYTDHTPDFLVVHVRFPGGAKAEYRTPIIKVGQYGLDDIFQKQLLFFLPYYIMRYEDTFPDIEKDDTKLQILLEEYQYIYGKLGELCTEHGISDYDFTELKRLMERVIRHVASGKERIQKGIYDMGGKVLEFEHDILMRQSETRGKAKELVKNVESIMRILNLSLEQACEAVEIPIGDYTKAKELILEDPMLK